MLTIIFTLPLFGVLIWSYFYPEESMLWGQRWMYKQEPEFSDIAIAFTQFGSGLMFCLLTLIFGASLFDHFLIRLLLCIGLIVYIIYGIRKLDKIMMK